MDGRSRNQTLRSSNILKAGTGYPGQNQSLMVAVRASSFWRTSACTTYASVLPVEAKAGTLTTPPETKKKTIK